MILLESGDRLLLESGDGILLESGATVPARRIFHEGVAFRPTHRPYQGGVGASLYVAAVDPNADPGPRAIEFRRNRTFDGCGPDSFVNNIGPTPLYDLAADTVTKSPRVASAESPDTEISYTIPAAWQSKKLHVQVRPFQGDYENETLYRPRSITLDGSGDPVTVIRGTATVTNKEKRDGGGLRLTFTYRPVRDGTQPTGFILRKMTGSGTIADGIVDYVVPAAANPLGQRAYQIDVSGLTNAVAYTFDLLATDGTDETTLVAGITFTGDSAGPGAVTGLVAVER